MLPHTPLRFSTIGQPILRIFEKPAFFDISVKNAFSISSILKRPERNTERGISRRLTFGPWAGSRPIWGIHRKFNTETNIFDDKTRCFSSLFMKPRTFGGPLPLPRPLGGPGASGSIWEENVPNSLRFSAFEPRPSVSRARDERGYHDCTLYATTYRERGREDQPGSNITGA